MPSIYKGVKAPNFTAGQFTDYADADKYEGRVKNDKYRATGKAKFANKLAAFIVAGCPKSQFNGPLYRTLSNCFGHIAHYDENGFYATWFSTDVQRYDFLRNIVSCGCYGQPEYTHSDVEQALKSWVRTSGILHEYRLEMEMFQHERDILTAKDSLSRLTPAERQELLSNC